MTTNDDEALYHELGHLIASMPNLLESPISPETNAWLGRAIATTERVDSVEGAMLSIVAQGLGGSSLLAPGKVQRIATILNAAMARVEQKMPLAQRGGFIAAGSPMGAFLAVSTTAKAANSDLLFVDAFADEVLLSDFAVTAKEGVAIRILCGQSKRKPSLKPAAERWLQEYGTSRPLSIHLVDDVTLHDRLMILDGTSAYAIGQSFNGLGKTSPTSIIQMPTEIAVQKVEAYDALWQVGASLL